MICCSVLIKRDVCVAGDPPMTGTGTLIIHVTDQNDNVPVLTSTLLQMCYSEEETGANISAVDQDLPPFSYPFHYEILGDVRGKWKIQPTSGNHLHHHHELLSAGFTLYALCELVNSFWLVLCSGFFMLLLYCFKIINFFCCCLLLTLGRVCCVYRLCFGCGLFIGCVLLFIGFLEGVYRLCCCLYVVLWLCIVIYKVLGGVFIGCVVCMLCFGCV